MEMYEKKKQKKNHFMQKCISVFMQWDLFLQDDDRIFVAKRTHSVCNVFNERKLQ